MGTIEPSDLRQTVLDELLLINDLMVKQGTWRVVRTGSTGAADRRYLQALGLLQRAGDGWQITPEGGDLIMQAMREGHSIQGSQK